MALPQNIQVFDVRWRSQKEGGTFCALFPAGDSQSDCRRAFEDWLWVTECSPYIRWEEVNALEDDYDVIVSNAASRSLFTETIAFRMSNRNVFRDRMVDVENRIYDALYSSSSHGDGQVHRLADFTTRRTRKLWDFKGRTKKPPKLELRPLSELTGMLKEKTIAKEI